MSHSYIKVIVHLIWATKNRQKLISKNARPRVEHHIRSYAKENEILLDIINVQIEHVHVLIYLLSNQQVDQIAKLLKGESSHWINANNLLPQRFSWQRGFGAFSVSPSHLNVVRRYIAHQDEHHRTKAFLEEYNEILKKYGFDPIGETDESVPL